MKRHLLTSAAGIDWTMEDLGADGFQFSASQEVTPILEANQAMESVGDGYSPDRSWRRVASIPLSLIHHWLTTEGWDAMSADPECQKKLCEKLDSEEFRYLRSAPGRLGSHWRHSI